MVRIEKQGAVWTVIHSRFAEARNAMDPDSADALAAAFREFDADDSASVAVLWGEGGASAPAGISSSRARSPIAMPSSVTSSMASRSRPARRAPRGPLGPTRTGIVEAGHRRGEGPAVAGGMELALWCDIRVMADSAYFGVYCRRWGIPLLDGGSVRLARLVGQGRAMEIILTGRKVPAVEALRIGMCEQVVETGGARAAAEAMAREIARFRKRPCGPIAARWSRPMVCRSAMRCGRNGPTASRRIFKEGADGAARFAGGKGRHGDFAQDLIFFSREPHMAKVLYERDGRIARITLNRPEVLNAIDDELPGALADAVARADNDPGAHVDRAGGCGPRLLRRIRPDGLRLRRQGQSLYAGNAVGSDEGLRWL